MAQQTIKIALPTLKIDFHIRKELNDDRALQFMAIYEAWLKDKTLPLPPAILVTPDGGVVDGRHRLKGAELAGMKDLDCVYVPKGLTPLETQFLAFECNLGGSLPPTQDDIRFFIMRLLKEGIQSSYIRKRLAQNGQMPLAVAKRYVDDALSSYNKLRMNQAKDLVAHGGMTVPAAAARAGVDIDVLRSQISGVKKSAGAKSMGLAKLNSSVSSIVGAAHQKVGKELATLLEQFEVGEVSESMLASHLKHIEYLYGRGTSKLKDYRRRFSDMQRLNDKALMQASDATKTITVRANVGKD